MEFDGETYKCSINSTKSIKALQFLSDLYNVYKVIQLDGSWTSKYQKGYVAMTVYLAGWYAGFLPSPEIAAGKYIAPFPKGPDKDTHISGLATYVGIFFIPTTTKDVENVVTVMTALIFLCLSLL